MASTLQLHFDLTFFFLWYQQNIGSVGSVEQGIKLVWPNYKFLCIGSSQIGMDNKEFNDSTFQRVYQYLRRYGRGQKLDRFKYQGTVEGNMADCLQHLLK